jgi:hypothetical protein
MKHLLLFVIVLAGMMSLSVNAQITITENDFPVIGNLVVRAVDNVTTINPGNPGTNQVWDFSNLVPVTYDSTYYISPVGVPGYQNYPQANIASDNNPNSYPGGGYNENFATVTSLGWKWIADESLVNLVGSYYLAFHITYTPEPYGLPFPFTYGSTKVQDFVMDLIIATRNGSVVTDSARTLSHVHFDMSADASGTMITPDASFPAIRVKEIWTSTDSSFTWTAGAWAYDSDTTTNWTQYHWYANDFGEVGLYDPNSKKKANGFTFFKSETLVGTGELAAQQKFTICPNPATSSVQVLSKLPVDKAEVLDISGNPVLVFTNKTSLDVSGIPSGKYFLRIYSGTGSTVQSFIKQ